MKKYITCNSDYPTELWKEIITKLESDWHNGMNPIYEMTDEGQYIDKIATQEEAKLGAELEPYGLGGTGGIVVYYHGDDYGFVFDYVDYCNDVIENAIDSKDEAEFRLKHRNYMAGVLHALKLQKQNTMINS